LMKPDVQKRGGTGGGGGGGRGCSCDAMTTPSWPSFGGPHAQAYANGSRCAEGSRRRNVSYTESVSTPKAFLVGWPGRPYADGLDFCPLAQRMSRPSARCAIPVVKKKLGHADFV
jgi:hypothetical protein